MNERLRTLLAQLPLPLVAAVVTSIALVWLDRWDYPFDLEWMEGGMLAHAWRLERGLPLYVEPNAEFIPYIYPPGYSAVLAAFSSFAELTPGLGRLVSITCTLLAAAAVGHFSLTMRASKTSAAVAAAAFLGAYPATAAFYDLVRPDAMALALVGWAIALAADGRRGTPVASGLLVMAAFAVKHNMAAFGLPILIVFAWRDGWKTAALFALFSVVPALAFVGWMQAITDGRFLVYLLEVPTSHPTLPARVFPGTPRDLGVILPVAVLAAGLTLMWRKPEGLPVPLATLPPLLLAGAVGFWGSSRPIEGEPVWVAWGIGTFGLTIAAVSVFTHVVVFIRREHNPGWRYVFAVSLGTVALALSASMRAHTGGHLNVHMPLFWTVSAGFGMMLGSWERSELPTRSFAVPLVAAAQLVWMLGSLDAVALTPTQADLNAGNAFVAEMKKTKGDVLSPHAAWMPVYAGKPPSLHLMGLWDLNYEGGPYKDQVGVIPAAMKSQRWSMAIEGSRPFGYGLRNFYQPSLSPVKKGDGALKPKSGWDVRPITVLLPGKPKPKPRK